MRRLNKIVLIFFSIIFFVGIFLFLKKTPSKGNIGISKGIVLFYGIGCPHCAKVEEFIRENKIKEKISFEEKEVYFNKKNAKLLGEVAKNCGLSPKEIGVPFLWDGQNCIVGDEPIINYFKEKLKI